MCAQMHLKGKFQSLAVEPRKSKEHEPGLGTCYSILGANISHSKLMLKSLKNIFFIFDQSIHQCLLTLE